MKTTFLTLALIHFGVVQSTPLTDVDVCMWNCPKTSEYNPICGSNTVRYYNMGWLLCAQYCGVDVQPVHPAPCRPAPTTSTENPWPHPTESTESSWAHPTRSTGHPWAHPTKSTDHPWAHPTKSTKNPWRYPPIPTEEPWIWS